MLPTFVIGLREGLEAALIVSIIATFLKTNGASLKAMWVGVTAAVALSIGVGVVLDAVEQHLPQAEQEGMETVIGIVAVFFVTGMILWMRTHARYMKRDLETAATSALSSGSGRALAIMAFLAVLREGFETAVFLLSTFQAASSSALAATGAVLGIVVAVGIGVGIYSGGVRLNLARFFKVTGVFLVFVAAGLVLSALRTAHEAGWVDVGQGRTVDLGWLAPTGAVQTALISGVLGIPSDPRVIELLGWACYLVPVLAITLWPASWQPTAARTAQRVRVGLGAAMAVLAVALMVGVTYPGASVAASAPLQRGGTAVLTTQGDAGTVAVTRRGHTTDYRLTDPQPSRSVPGGTQWALSASSAAGLPARLTLTRLLTFTGQRVPVGLDAAGAPGPYDATWRERGSATATTLDGGLVDASSSGSLLLTISGGGLSSSRVLTVDDPTGTTTWAVTDAQVSATTSSLAAVRSERLARELWKWWFPIALLVASAALLFRAGWQRRTARRAADAPIAQPGPSTPSRRLEPQPR